MNTKMNVKPLATQRAQRRGERGEKAVFCKNPRLSLSPLRLGVLCVESVFALHAGAALAEEATALRELVVPAIAVCTRKVSRASETVMSPSV